MYQDPKDENESSSDFGDKSTDTLLQSRYSTSTPKTYSKRNRIISVAHYAHYVFTTVLMVAVLVLASQDLRAHHHPKSDSHRTPFIPLDIATTDQLGNPGHHIKDPIPYDLFHNITVLEKRTEELGIHNSTGIKVNGNYKTWRDHSGVERHMHPHISPGDIEAYAVSSFHQMHCLLETLRDYGYLLNGYRPKWNDEHTIHCFNTFYKIIACLSDPTVEGYPDKQPITGPIRGAAVSEVASRPLCRNFQELREWANEPVRAIPFSYDSLKVHDMIPLAENCDLRNCRDSGGWKKD